MVRQHQSENFVIASRTRLRLLPKRDFLLRTRFFREPVECSSRTRWRWVRYVASIFISNLLQYSWNLNISYWKHFTLVEFWYCFYPLKLYHFTFLSPWRETLYWGFMWKVSIKFLKKRRLFLRGNTFKCRYFSVSHPKFWAIIYEIDFFIKII